MSECLVNLYQVVQGKKAKMTDELQRGSRGPAPSWNLGRTRTIRVPIVLADTLMQIAKKLDNGEALEPDILLTKEDRQEISKSPQYSDRLCTG